MIALKPIDQGWYQWVAPLQSAIQDFRDEISKLTFGDRNVSANRLAASTEIARLSVSFQYLPIEELVFRLKLIKALVSSDSQGGKSIVNLSAKYDKPRGDELPVNLERLLRSVETEELTIGLRLRENEDFVLTLSADEARFQFKRELSPGVIELRARGASGEETLGVNRNNSLSYFRSTKTTGAAVYKIPIPNGVFYDALFSIRPVPKEMTRMELYLITK